MASTYTLDQAVGYVRSDLSAKGVQFYDDLEIQRWLRAAHREFARDLRFFQTSASDTTVLNTPEYAWPTDCLEITAVTYVGTYITGRGTEWLTTRNPNWRNATAGVPTCYYLQPLATIGLWPKPSLASQALKFYGVFVPTFPASGSTVFAIPAQWEDALIALACAKTAAKDVLGGGAVQAQYFEDEYNKLMQKALQSAYGGDDVVAGDNAKTGQGSPVGLGVNTPISG